MFPRRPGLPPLLPTLAAPRGPWVEPVAPENPLVGPRTLRVVGESVDLGREGWSAADRSALVRYNLHYFDCARVADGAQAEAWCHALIEDWLAANPAGTALAWDPYPISLRLVNWIKSYLRGGSLSPAVVESIAHQGRWLAANLERDIRANHLFANGKALVFAGLATTGGESDQWRSIGRSLVLAEAAEQQLDDGAHFERSPMYHATFTEDLLDLVNVARWAGDEAIAGALAPRAASALAWLAEMTHPDGEIAFFNDAAFGIAPRHAELASYAARLGIAQPASFPTPTGTASGYVRLEAGQAVVLADVAPLGPDYQPGHAHADTLSFELSLGSQRIVVNSGTSLYGTSAERQRQRGTAAHSTLQLDGADSSEVWAGFRVGRRARVWCERPSPNHVTGTHDGYRSLPGKPRHKRSWRLGPDAIEIVDQVWGKRGAWDAVSRFHLHPAIATSHSGNTVRLSLPGDFQVEMTSDRAIEIVEGTWHPRFGESIPNLCLEVRWRAGGDEPQATTQFRWKS